MKKKILIGLLAVAAGIAAWRLSSPREFFYAGTVEATEVDVSARVASPVAAYEVFEGAEVSEGQTLVRLSGEDIRLAKEQTERDFQRAKKLYEGGSVSQEVFDRLRFLRDDAALRAGWCEVRSPLAGTVLRVYHEAGEQAMPGTKLLTLADLREVWAYVYVPQPLLARISLGQEVEGLLPETGRALKGTIRFIRSEAEFTPKNVQTREERTRLVYGVKVVFPNPERVLKPGMTVEVRLPRGK
ncbi:MAG TPA: efflux RND transporter periplasmic adaptor subunit [Elusimicrobiota bacterium]|nr:efflux RND transporter periplasmic adaptor subunit [Elusimicrobiota bacterium]